MDKRVLITGIDGQIGSYMADFLLSKGYKIYGIVRYRTSQKLKNITHLQNKIEIIEGNILDVNFLNSTFKKIRPHYIFNFASQSNVGASFYLTQETAEATGLSVLYVLDAIRNSGFNSKFWQASTSELFGNSSTTIQNEQTRFEPASVYAVSKLFGHHLVKIYRESYNMWACCGILFNTESPRRGETFLTKKVVKHAVEIFKGKRDYIELGNLNSKRDWQSVHDVVEGICLQMNHKEPDEFVFASGKTHSVRDFVHKTFNALGVSNYEHYIQINPAFLRPNDVNYLCGDASKAKRILGWESKKTLDDIVEEMVEYELKKHERT